MMKKYIFFFLLLSCFFSKAQNIELSVYSEISIVTSGPGENLYEKFGHTAIRVKDPVLNLDILYNYGIFDFNDPNFYANFVRGFMKYKLAKYPFHLSLKAANYDERWVKQQVLNLNQKERTKFFRFLENNAKPENASYFYDPFFDNCATRPRDIITDVLGDKFIFKDKFITSQKSLRDLMNEKIHQNTWGSFGINLALGSRLDNTAKPQEYLYLPEYVFRALEVSNVKEKDVIVTAVKKTDTLLDFDHKLPNGDTINPLLIFTLLLLVVLLINYRDYRNNSRTKLLDFIILFSTGIVGSLIIFLWFFTNHSTAPKNFNFLWAFAPNLVLAFFFLKKNISSWLRNYILLLLILIVIILPIHIFGIQKFTYPNIPLIIMIFVRYLFLYKYLKK